MCKLEHYGNCDPETKDQEYCIFHKPNKNEMEAREFWRKFSERFKPGRETIHIKSTEDVIIVPDGEMTVERLIFEDSIDCRGFIFPENPEDVNIKFEYAVFKKDANFWNAIFECDVDFAFAIFKGDVYFIGSMFKEKCTFLDTIFEKDAYFSGAMFEKYVCFISTIFKGSADFNRATFKKFVDFTGKKKCEKYKFYGELNFSNAEFQKGINIDIPSKWFKLPQAEAEACRVQRIWYEKEGNKDKADEMFVRERRALRKDRVRQAKEKLKASKGVKSKLKSILNLIKAYGSSFMECLIADSICEYGTNWKRPILLWLIVVLGSSFIYWLTHSVPNANDFWSNLYFSIVTATTLGYGDLHPVGWGRVLASFEAVFGTFMWAIFLAVFARKYMR